MESLYVIKIGGNIVDNPVLLTTCLQAFAKVKGQAILVHGGGKMATSMAESLGIEQNIIEGRRITDEDTLKIVTMVYAGYINKTIVALLQKNAINSMVVVDLQKLISLYRRHSCYFSISPIHFECRN